MHLVGFIIRIYHDARSSECQNNICTFAPPPTHTQTHRMSPQNVKVLEM